MMNHTAARPVTHDVTTPNLGQGQASEESLGVLPSLRRLVTMVDATLLVVTLLVMDLAG